MHQTVVSVGLGTGGSSVLFSSVFFGVIFDFYLCIYWRDWHVSLGCGAVHAYYAGIYCSIGCYCAADVHTAEFAALAFWWWWVFLAAVHVVTAILYYGKLGLYKPVKGFRPIE